MACMPDYKISSMEAALKYIAEAAEKHPKFLGIDADIDALESEGGDAAFVTDIAQCARNALLPYPDRRLAAAPQEVGASLACESKGHKL